MKIYILENKEMPWGDYGNILLSGMSYEENNEIILERTGPFVPPIIESGLGIIIITNDFKEKLKKSGLVGFDFIKVKKKKIVELNWDKWNFNSDEPDIYPETGEPEDYIDLGKHSVSISNQVGDLWSLKIVNDGLTDRKQLIADSSNDIWLISSSIKEYDFFIPEGVLWICISEKAKYWLEQNSEGFLQYKEIVIK